MAIQANSKLTRLLETQQLAHELMAEHGLIERGWSFSFANDKRTVGWCKHSHKLIQVSKHYIESHPDEIRDTILHEIAHALVGTGHGHDHVWRMKCIDIGANPMRTTDKAQFSGDYNYTTTCTNCGWVHGRHRIKSAFWHYHCKFCKGPITVIDHKTGDIHETTP